MTMTRQIPDHALQDRVIVLLGGGGFLGTHLAQELLARGARLRVASRHPERAVRIKPLGNLGQVQLARCDITRPETVAPLFSGADGVVNLVGAFAGDLDAVQGNGLEPIAASARAAGVRRFVHLSAIGADPAAATAYGRSKAAGEAAVLRAFPQAAVVRPSVLFGPDDSFINLFAGLIAALPAVPVFGPDKQLQPVFVDDVAQAITRLLTDAPAAPAALYELGGPEVLSMLDLHRQIARAQGRAPWLIALPDPISGAFAAATGWLPGAPLTRDQWRLLAAGNRVSGQHPGLAELGITPRPLTLFLERWMQRYRRHGRFGVRAQA